MKNLTEKELILVKAHLSLNGCSAKTTTGLLKDNYSCVTLKQLHRETKLDINVIKGLLSSLSKKNIIAIEERDDDSDLYWITDEFLENNKDYTIGGI